MNSDLALKRPQSFPQHRHDVCTAVEIHGRRDLHHQADSIPATISLLPLGSSLASEKDTFGGAQLVRSAGLGDVPVKIQRALPAAQFGKQPPGVSPNHFSNTVGQVSLQVCEILHWVEAAA